jgi:predicted acyl esterase
VAILGSAAAGQDAGIWGSYGAPGDFPPDQRAEDGRALSLTSPPLATRLEILGFPTVTLSLVSDRPQALVAVRLCDVWPDGASTLITRGLLNLSHRDGHDTPQPLVPGERYTVTVALDAIGYALPAGHCLRVAISPTYWPLAWPSPSPATLTVFTGEASWLDLPVRAPRPEDDALPPFGAPEDVEPLASVELRSGSSSQMRTTDVIAGIHRWTDHRDDGRVRLVASGIEMEDTATDDFEIRDGDPLSATVRCQRTCVLAEPGWEARIEAAATHTATAEVFHITSHIDAYEGATRVFTRSWTFAIPRDNG